MQNSPKHDRLLAEKIRLSLLRCMFDAVCDDYESRIEWFNFNQKKILKNIRGRSLRFVYIKDVKKYAIKSRLQKILTPLF
ncbi:MAG: hypothetical protein LRY43_02245 [Gammaproteobacteria bacterium]|nr:hypothetical protein [Gammaproteobacteria bacterium]